MLSNLLPILFSSKPPTWYKLLAGTRNEGTTVEWKGTAFNLKQGISIRGLGTTQTADAVVPWELWTLNTDVSPYQLGVKVAQGNTAAVKAADGYLSDDTVSLNIAPGNYCLCFNNGTGYGYSQVIPDGLSNAEINARLSQWLKGGAGPLVSGKALIADAGAGVYDMRIKY